MSCASVAYAERQGLSSILNEVSAIVQQLEETTESEGNLQLQPDGPLPHTLRSAPHTPKPKQRKGLPSERVRRKKVSGKVKFEESSTTSFFSRASSGIDGTVLRGAHFAKGQVCDVLEKYFSDVLVGAHLGYFGTSLSWASHITGNERNGTAFAFALVASWRNMASSLFLSYAMKKGIAEVSDGASDPDARPFTGHSSKSLPHRYYTCLLQEAGNSRLNHAAEELALFLVGSYCEDFPLQVWNAFLHVSRYAWAKADLLPAEDRPSAEMLLVRCMLLCTTKRQALGDDLLKRRDPIHGDNTANGAPKQVICDVRRLYDALGTASKDSSVYNSLLQSQAAVVLSDICFLWLTQPYSSMVSHFLLYSSCEPGDA